VDQCRHFWLLQGEGDLRFEETDIVAAVEPLDVAAHAAERRGATIKMSGMIDHVGQRQVASNDREIGEQNVARTWDSIQVRRLRPGGNRRPRFSRCRIIGLTAQHLGDGDPLGAGGIGDDQLVRQEDGKGFAADEDAGAPVCVAVTRWHLLADCNDVVGLNVGLPQLCEGGFRAAIG
jgi:hypothetical protein